MFCKLYASRQRHNWHRLHGDHIGVALGLYQDAVPKSRPVGKCFRSVFDAGTWEFRSNGRYYLLRFNKLTL